MDGHTVKRWIQGSNEARRRPFVAVLPVFRCRRYRLGNVLLVFSSEIAHDALPCPLVSQLDNSLGVEKEYAPPG